MQTLQCPYNNKGNAVAIGVAVKMNDGDVVIVVNDTVMNPDSADVWPPQFESLKKGVNIVSDDKCVRINLATKVIKKGPGFFLSSKMRVKQEAASSDGICGSQDFGKYFVDGTKRPNLFPPDVFETLCKTCADATGVVVPGCETDQTMISPGCEFMQQKEGEGTVLDCVGSDDVAIETAKADGANCAAYVRLSKEKSCEEFCGVRGTKCTNAIDNVDGQTCLATVDDLADVNTNRVNCKTEKFNDLVCVCEKPMNPAPGPTPEEACADSEDPPITVEEAEALCKAGVPFLSSVSYPGTNAGGDIGMKEDILEDCIQDVCSSIGEDRDAVIDLVNDQNPPDEPVDPTEAPTEEPEEEPPAVPGIDLYVFWFPSGPGTIEEGAVEIKFPGDGDDGTVLLSWKINASDNEACLEDCDGDNCCGITINEATSCDGPAGPTLWNRTNNENPYDGLRYFDGVGQTYVPLNIGLGPEDVVGKVVIVYDDQGNRIGCGLIDESSTSPFERYPGYDGPLPLTSGGMEVIPDDDGKQILRWIFPTGLDPACSEECSEPNCCGVHIHEGTSCDDASAVGGHFWDKEEFQEDPWMTVRYFITGPGPTVTPVAPIEVVTGLTYEQVDGRTVVIHDFSGTRIGCAVIDLPDLPLEPVRGDDLYVFGLPFTYGSDEPEGAVEIKFPGAADPEGNETTLLSWKITEADRRCRNDCTRPNCCGIRIHDADDCEGDLGEILWNKAAVPENPWTPARYYNGVGVIYLPLATGLTAAEVEGKVLVIYDFRGNPLACGGIEQSDTTPFEKYPTYGGELPLTSGGLQIVTDDDGTQTLNWIFPTGLDERCTEVCDVPNCCGVHIHAGTSCETADEVGGHFWNETLLSEDPWQDVQYIVDGPGPEVVNLLEVTTKLTDEEIDGRVVVVHDADGVRIACSIIDLATAPAPQPEPNVSSAIEKLEDAMDSIKDALGELGAAVNGSGKGGYPYYKPGYPGYPMDKHGPGKGGCRSICADICAAEHPQPPNCEEMCWMRTNKILDVVAVFCDRGVCPAASLAETQEEVGLLQSRTHRGASTSTLDDEDLSDEDDSGLKPCEPKKYCQRFCKNGFILPPEKNLTDKNTRIQTCLTNCIEDFAQYEVPLQNFKDGGCCENIGMLYD